MNWCTGMHLCHPVHTAGSVRILKGNLLFCPVVLEARGGAPSGDTHCSVMKRRLYCAYANDVLRLQEGVPWIVKPICRNVRGNHIIILATDKGFRMIDISRRELHVNESLYKGWKLEWFTPTNPLGFVHVFGIDCQGRWSVSYIPQICGRGEVHICDVFEKYKREGGCIRYPENSVKGKLIVTQAVAVPFLSGR
jgi:hypothetical protein